MKESKDVKDRGDIVEEPEQSKQVPTGPDEPVNKQKKKWYELIPYEKMWPLMPKLRYVRGSKAKIQFTTFEAVNEIAKTLYETHKYFFRTKAQVDNAAYYIGTRILEQCLLVRKGLGTTPWSSYMESKEGQYQQWDDIKIIMEEFDHVLEHYLAGHMDEDEFVQNVHDFQQYVADKGRISIHEKLEKVLSDKMSLDTFRKIKDRLRKRKSRDLQRKVEKSGLSLVGTENQESTQVIGQ